MNIIDDFIFKNIRLRDNLRNLTKNRYSICKDETDAFTYFEMFHNEEFNESHMDNSEIFNDRPLRRSTNMKDYIYCLLNFQQTRERYEQLIKWIITRPDLYKYSEVITEVNLIKLIRTLIIQNQMDILSEIHNILISLNDKIKDPYKLVDFKKVSHIIKDDYVLYNILSMADNDSLKKYLVTLYDDYESLEDEQQQVLTKLLDNWNSPTVLEITEHVKNWNKVKGLTKKISILSKDEQLSLKSIIDETTVLTDEQKKLVYSRIL